MVNVLGGGTRALLRIENNNSVGSPGIIFGEGGGFTEDTQPTIKKVQGTNNLAIMCGGNVGIGTTGPIDPLHVQSTTSTARLTGTTNFTTSAFIFDNKLGAYWHLNGYGNNPTTGARGAAYAAGQIICGSETNNNYENSYMAFQVCYDPQSDGTGGLGVTTERMRIKSNGNVGIGTTNPGFPLEIGTVATNTFASSYGFYSGSGLTTGITGAQSVGAKIAGYVWSTNGFLATSDARIKIVNPEPISNCLNAVNQLRVCKYEYIDKITDKSNKLGFIAQEVQKAIPESVTISESIVPNIFKMAESVQSNVITIADHGLVAGDTVKLVYGSGAVETNVCIVLDTSTFQVEAEIKDESVFVYGKKVNDFLTLDHTQVFTCAIGAIQELSTENTALKQSLASATARLDLLESRLAAAGI
jgi:hypothetical protein